MPTLQYNGQEYSDEIESGYLELDHAMVGETLTVDTLKVSTITQDTPIHVIASDMAETDFILSSDGAILAVYKGAATPVPVKNSPGYLYNGIDLVGKYYLTEFKQTSAKRNELIFYSAIRLLEQSYHYGGIYDGDTAGDIIADIIGSTVSYTVDEDVAAIDPGRGYLPYATRRANLQLLLMAIGAHVKNASDGTLRITSLSETVTGEFGASRVFYGGSVVDENAATAVQVTEHNFIESTEEVTLYDNSTTATETIIFNEPYHDYAITGGTIVSSGANYVTFTGTGACVITGQKYVHITRVVTHGTTPTGSADDIVKTVTSNTMINPTNATQVAEILYDYYSIGQTIKQTVIVGTERPGDVVDVVHPYTRETVSAVLKNMKWSIGKALLTAVSEFKVGYIPPGLVSGFTNYALLTSSGTWTVPAGVTLIRVILVEPGQGGTGGSGGSKPALYGNAGAAGVAGAAGLSGRILEFNMVVTPGAGISYSAPSGTAGGAGGAGATTTGAGVAGSAASEPSATTFGAYSSATGRRYPSGYNEPKSGLTFAMDAENGVDGGDGGGQSSSSESVTYNGMTWTGGSVGFYGGTPVSGGGGAAVGSNGGNAVVSPPTNTGGAGASADDRDNATHYGEGGAGGHGGGGGGGASNTALTDAAGVGGNGGDGGDGYAGCIVVYY